MHFIDGHPANLNIEKKRVDLIAGTTASVLLKNISLFEKSGFTSFQKKWNLFMYAKNQDVTLTCKDREIIGKILGINNKGELEIQTSHEIICISDINYSMRILS